MTTTDNAQLWSQDPPRIVYHIGQHKTGTSALQAALVRDRSRLERHGILYPNLGHERYDNGTLGANHNGLHYIYSRPHHPWIWQGPDEIRAALAAQYQRVRPHTIVVSAEHAFFAADRRAAKELGGIDELFPGPKEVVAFLRRPSDFVVSWHKQLLRFGVAADVPPYRPRGVEALLESSRVNYRHALEPYLNRWGSVRVFSYGPDVNTTATFYSQVLGLRPPRLARRLYKSLPDVFAHPVWMRLRRGKPVAEQQFASLIGTGIVEPVDLLGPANRQRIAAAFEPTNRWLGEQFGDDAHIADPAGIDQSAGMISVSQAGDRYRPLFVEIMSS